MFLFFVPCGSQRRAKFMKFNFLLKIWYRINPRYKDRLFCKIFGREKHKDYALSLYNAVNHSNYTDQSELEIITLEDAVYIKMKNDVAYLISDNIAVYEHQSTVNDNMPIRGFMYFGELYSKILKGNRTNIYGRRLVKIPTPQYIVFYNGTDDYPEVKKLKLSDAFMDPGHGDEFEFTATVFNINLGKNEKLLESCKPLKEYSIFVDTVRRKGRKMPAERAVDEAVRECIRNNILKDVLSEERSSVMLEMLSSFDEKVYEEGLREEGREEGRKEGREEGRKEGREEERRNTEHERERADKAEARADNAEAELKKYKERFGELETKS